MQKKTVISYLLSSLQSKHSFLCISETWNREDNVISCTLDGYSGFHTYQPKKYKRGISILVFEKFVCAKIEKLSKCNDETQTCAVEVQQNHEFLLVLIP